MSTIEIFKLFGSVFVDNEKANKNLKATDKHGQSVGKTFGKGIKTIGKWGLVAGAAATAVGGAMFGAASKVADFTDNIDKMSQKIGISREAYQEWDFVLSQTGASVDGLKTGVKTLSKAAFEASQGVSTYKDNFDELGISVEDGNGNLKDQETLLKETIIALQGMEDETKRTAIASELLGRSASELAPLLNAGSGATEELTKKAHDLGLVLGDDVIDAGVQFTDSMDQLKRSMKSVGVSIFGGLMPAFNKIIEWVIGKMPVIQEKFRVVFGVVRDVIMRAYDVVEENILPVFKRLWDFIKSFFPQIKNTASNTFDKILEVVGVVWNFINDNLIPLFERLVLYIMDNWPLIKETFITVFDKIIEVATNVWVFFRDNILPILNNVWNLIRDNWPTLKETFVNVFQSIWDIINDVWKILDATLMPVLESIYDYINDNWDFIAGVFTGAFTLINDSINFVIDSIESLVGWLKDAVDWFGKFFTAKNEKGSTDLGVGGGSLGLTGVEIDGARANGGPILKGKTYLVGERGPELITPNQNGMVTPNGAGGITIVVKDNTLLGDSDEMADKLGELLVGRLRGLGALT